MGGPCTGGSRGLGHWEESEIGRVGVEFKGEDKGFCQDIEGLMAGARWV